MDIRPVQDADLPALRELREAARRADAPWLHPPTVRQLHGELRHGHDGEPPACFVGRLEDGGPVVAEGHLHLSEWDNHDLAWLDVTVHPDHRARGLGARMWEHVRAEGAVAGRTSFGASVWSGSAGEPFLAARGLTRRTSAFLRRQHLDELDLDGVRGLRDQAAAHAAAYDVLLLDGDLGADRLEALATIAASINDAPVDDLDLEDEVYTAERLHDFQVANAARDRDLHRAVAVERSTGKWVGQTVVVVERETPDRGHQLDTSVVGAHRGHRLGLLLKASMVLHLTGMRPRLRTVDTWNAEANGHMGEVNEQLGYRVLARRVDYQA